MEAKETHELSVSFRKMNSEDMTQVFQSLPPLKEGDTCSTETMHAYLDAKIQYETLSADRTLQVEDEVLLSLIHI